MELLSYKFLAFYAAGNVITSKGLALHRTRNPQAPAALSSIKQLKVHIE